LTSSTPDEDQFFSEDFATFGDRLEAARSAKGLSVEGLAAKIGVKKRTVMNWENDIASPRANRLSMLAGLLNVSIVWLITGQGNGTLDVVEGYDRSQSMNETIGEIKALKQTLLRAVDKIEKLENRLLENN